jgi:MSHA pilin protein MshC
MQAIPRQSGFTLTELIIVIVILGVLSAVAMPMWFSKSDFEARGYFDEVIQAARYAQKMAVVSNCPVEFAVTGDGFSLAILAHTDFPHCVNTPISLPGKSPPYIKPSGITSGTANVTFRPSGSASTGTTIAVGGHSMQIHAATGYVERL